MKYRGVVLAAGFLLLIAVTGCGSSTEQQIADSAERILVSQIESGNSRLNEQTGGGIESVETVSFDTDRGVAVVRVEAANGEVQIEKVDIEHDGGWQVRI